MDRVNRSETGLCEWEPKLAAQKSLGETKLVSVLFAVFRWALKAEVR